MKKKLELQTIVILLCALGIAGSWIGMQIVNNSRGEWSEACELRFATPDLLDLGQRSEVRCAGAVIGHVRDVLPEIAEDGSPRFTVIAGIGPKFSKWKFKPVGVVKFALVQSALSPSWINLETDATDSGVLARKPKEGPPPLLSLVREPVKLDFDKLSAQVSEVLDGVTKPENGKTKSMLDELKETIRHLDAAAASLQGQSPLTESDPGKPQPIERILAKLEKSGDNLESVTESLKTTVGKGGELDRALKTLNDSLLRFEKLTDETTKAINHLNLRVDSSIGKVNGLLDETSGTMSTLQGKADRLGETFLGRWLIGKPDQKAATPAPKKAPRRPGR